MIHVAKDLSADEKAVIEGLLGRRVLDDEEISVRAFHSSSVSRERLEEEVQVRSTPGILAKADRRWPLLEALGKYSI